jgi:drug/metabolite transporter (DMT)-like permease
MQWALESTPAGIVFAILAITPIIIIPFARVLEGERPTVRSLVGGYIPSANRAKYELSGLAALRTWQARRI